MLTRIYQFENYRLFLHAWIKSQPKKGRGQLTRLAEKANIHKTTMSQILAGQKDLSLEQACRICEHIGLTSVETEYFLLLVNYERAGSANLRAVFKGQIENLQNKQKQLSNRVTQSKRLGNEERAIYYSHWIYAAVRNLCAIKEFRNIPSIAKRLNLETTTVQKVVDFLLATSLCEEKHGELLPVPSMTHLEASSPLVARHHANWRVKAMERHPVLREEELSYTAPMTLSQKDATKIRALLADLVQDADKIVGPSPSEKLYCLSLDWFEIR